MKEYWKTQLPPFRLADDLCYVGTDKGPSYLLETSDGPILIDTGFPQTVYMLLENIRTMGYNPYEIRHIIHSHGHIDHVGGTCAICALTGAKTYIGAPDADAVAGRNHLIYAEELKEPFEEYFEPDILLNDGDVLTFGETAIRFVSTPGHTVGTMSIFFDVTVDGKKYPAGMFGGAGLNTLSSEYLENHGLPDSMRDAYLTSIERLKKEPVELHIGNHLSDNGSRIKMPYADRKPNPFLADKTWLPFLDGLTERATVFFSMKG